MVRIAWFMALLPLLAGCRSSHPCYVLDPWPYPKPEVILPIELVDARPDWERQSSFGPTTPRRYKSAFSFIDLESFHPSPLAYLCRAIEREALQLADPPCEARLILHSFRVVINDIERMQDAYEMDLQRDREEERRSDLQKQELRQLGWHEDEPSFLEELVGKAMGVVLEAAWVAALDRPPKCYKKLRDQYPPEVSCDLKATLSLHWVDGRRQEIPLSALANSTSLPGKDPHHYPTAEMRAVINMAIFESASAIAEKAGR